MPGDAYFGFKAPNSDQNTSAFYVLNASGQNVSTLFNGTIGKLNRLYRQKSSRQRNERDAISPWISLYNPQENKLFYMIDSVFIIDHQDYVIYRMPREAQFIQAITDKNGNTTEKLTKRETTFDYFLTRKKYPTGIALDSLFTTTWRKGSVDSFLTAKGYKQLQLFSKEKFRQLPFQSRSKRKTTLFHAAPSALF